MVKVAELGSNASAQFLSNTTQSLILRARSRRFLYTRRANGSVSVVTHHTLMAKYCSHQYQIQFTCFYFRPPIYARLYVLAEHKRYGRLIMFWTMNCDLLVVLSLVAQTGGLASPIMCAQLLNTTFFALLFPSPVGVVAPMLMLPAATWVTLQSGHPSPW